MRSIARPRRPRPPPALPSCSPLLAVALACLALVTTFAATPRALGTFKLKSTEATEVSGAWHIYVTIELPKAPLTAHQTMKFNFTKTMAYERALIDGHNEPVLNRQALQNQTPSVESLDVDFADPSGKIFKGTRFDFGLTRTRGYEAGEYKVEVKTADGVSDRQPARTLILKGDNPVVDRRAIAFNAKEPGVKKVEGYDAGAKAATNDNTPRREQQHGRGHADRHRPAVHPEGGLPEDLRGRDQDAAGAAAAATSPGTTPGGRPLLARAARGRGRPRAASAVVRAPEPLSSAR